MGHKLKNKEDRTVEATFIWYASGSHGYKLWTSQNKRVIVLQDVSFDECCVLDETHKHGEGNEYAELDSSDKPSTVDTSIP